MPKIVIIGSCEYEPYIVLAMPNKLDQEMYETDHEESYRRACKLFYPAIDEADIVIVYAPDGLDGHPHTQRDMEYALSKGKRIFTLKECLE